MSASSEEQAGAAPAAQTERAPRILVVDDDRNTRTSLQRALERDGYDVVAAENGKVALGIAQGGDEIDLVLTDLIMPGLDGLGFLEGLRVVRPDVPTILFSAFANVDTAVKAGRRGVFEVLEKPIRLRDVRRAVRRAMKAGPPERGVEPRPKRAAGAAPAARGRVPRTPGARPLVGESESFREVVDLACRVAPVSSTVLLLGESGTGKEVLAELIHARSSRADGPLVKLACAALAEGVLEAELFGNERGAYTGAHEQRKGRFEVADGGTLFLDEIGELSLPLQVKLLRVLQEGEFERVGGSETLRADVRVITATNRNLHEEVRAGRFREDLYWRLNVIALHMPPLRDRREDLPLLSEHFLRLALEKTGRQRPARFAAETLSCIQAYDWPGNVRELENAVERAVVLARGEAIELGDLPEQIRDSAGTTPRPSGEIRFEVGQPLAQLEREAIRRTLEAVGGNRETAASLLGIGVATLYRRLKDMEADAEADAEAEAGAGGEGQAAAE